MDQLFQRYDISELFPAAAVHQLVHEIYPLITSSFFIPLIYICIIFICFIFFIRRYIIHPFLNRKSKTRLKMNNPADIRLIDQLLEKKMFNCARCNNLLQAPIMLVDGVGNMCHSCYGALENNDNVTALENVALNLILDYIEIPCTYKTQGCEKRLKCKDFQTHTDQCAYATLRCDFSPTCLWTGCFSQLESHCREHKDIILSNADDCYKFQVMQDFKQSTNILGTSCGFFFLKMKKLKDVLKIIIYDLTHRDKIEYNFDVTFEANSGSKYTRTCKAINNFKSFTIFDTSSELSIDMNLINNSIFCNEINVEMSIKLITDYKSDTDELLPLVSCSKCSSYIRTEIYACVNGHNHCKSCKMINFLGPSRCSLCSKFLVRFQPLEKLAKFVRRPCRFKDDGCPVKSHSSSHELTCIFRTWNCFISSCFHRLSYPELVLHAKNHHKIPNGFINLPGLKIKREVAETQVYHVLEHDLLFELIYENEPITRITKQGDSYDKCYGATLIDQFVWKVSIIGEYDIHLYKFEVEICFGKANPIESIILRGSCKIKNLGDTSIRDYNEWTVELSGDTLDQLCSAESSTCDYKVRVFEEL